MKAYQPQTIKEHNQNLILLILKKSLEPMTKRQLSEHTGLSIVTINKLLPQLMDQEIILALDEPKKTGGRFASVYKINAQLKLVLILQFIEQEGRPQALLHIVNLIGEVIESQSVNATEAEPIFSVLKSLVARFPQIALIMVGIPGVEVDGKLVVMDFKPFLGMNLIEKIYSLTDKVIAIENDINAATLGFANIKEQVLAGIYFPEHFPPGATLVINQAIFKGRNNLSGEIKYLPHFDKLDYPLKTSMIEKNVLESIQAITAMYDPEHLVLFLPDTWSTLIDLERLKATLSNLFPHFEKLPELTLSYDFSNFYLEGLIKLALQQIELI